MYKHLALGLFSAALLANAANAETSKPLTGVPVQSKPLEETSHDEPIADEAIIVQEEFEEDSGNDVEYEATETTETKEKTAEDVPGQRPANLKTLIEKDAEIDPYEKAKQLEDGLIRKPKENVFEINEPATMRVSPKEAEILRWQKQQQGKY
ncbi:MAG: hypothetical protein COV36_03075 [Alphaproteobacteria bacterium CG11_big_fil_rev_8_21_14_0_20_44_7]|nr:MAG: hypothetical protein COV36_03075 [Alphaproteobacteria bacterium CG11_big_fil_rev_8_21_14_0_20_44_7]